MGAGQSDLYSGTYGDTAENIPDALKGRIKMPRNDSQYFVGKDMWGNDWHIRNNKDGTQDWVEHQNQVISDGGRNLTNKEWDFDTGLKYNPLRRKKNE